MPFIKNTNTWLSLSAVALVIFAVLGVAVHASTANTDKRSRESCSSAGHKQFHTDAKKVTTEWWDQAGPKDEKGHQQLLKSLKKQHTAFHKVMRKKKPCPPLSLSVGTNVSSTSLPVAKSGSTVPTVGSPAKRAAPGPSPAAPSVSVPSPSGNGSPSLSVPAISPSLSPVTSSSSASGSSLSRVSSVSSSGTTKSVASSVAAVVPSIAFSAITVRNITQESATIEWTTDQPVVGQVYWGDTPTYGIPSPEGPVNLTHSITLHGLDQWPGNTTFYFAVFALNNEKTKILARVNGPTFQTPPVAIEKPGNATYTLYRVYVGVYDDLYTPFITDPDGIATSCGTSLYGFDVHLLPTDFPHTVQIRDCAGHTTERTVAMPPPSVVERPGNTTLKVDRVSGDKYTLTVANPAKLLSLRMLTASGKETYIARRVFDAPMCESSSFSTTLAYPLYPADFPLKAIVTDCAGNASEVTAEMPPQ